jgi:hypothetical protein
MKRKKESSFFEKKEAKKLLSVSGGTGPSFGDHGLGAIDKSFLLLFFKKEDLPSSRSFA